MLTNPDFRLFLPWTCDAFGTSWCWLKRSISAARPSAKQGTKWQLTAANLSEAFWQRADRLTALRRDEQHQMQEYVSLRSGHMEFLIQALTRLIAEEKQKAVSRWEQQEPFGQNAANEEPYCHAITVARVLA